MPDSAFTPALGRAELSGVYDLAIRLLTRESAWRPAFLRQIQASDGEVILDVGCGTGSLAIMLKRATPGARVVGLDPDPDILKRAAAKAVAAGVDIEFKRGFARDAAQWGATFDKTVSSLVFHQVPAPEKRAGIAAMLAAVRPGGEVHIADYAGQLSWPMRQLFRIVQSIDGYENTQPNADGVLEQIIRELSGNDARALKVIGTPTGAVSLFRILSARRQIEGKDQ